MADEIVAVYRAEVEQYKKAVDELTKKVNELDKSEKDVAKTSETAFNKGKQSADGMGSSVSSLTKQMKSLAAAVGVAFTVDRVIAFARESVKLAASAEGVERAFKRVGSPQLLEGLRQATRGTVSDLQLMQNAVKASNFQIPLENLASLFKFAQARARETGESVDYLVDSIILGIGRKSPLILDNLGISAVALREKFNGLSAEAAGVGDVAKAVGEIAEEEMRKMGEQADTTADKLAQLSVAWDKISIAAGKGLVNLGTGFAYILGLLEDVDPRMQGFMKALDGIKADRIKDLASGYRDLTDIYVEIEGQLKKVQGLEQELIDNKAKWDERKRMWIQTNEQIARTKELTEFLIPSEKARLDLLRDIFEAEKKRQENAKAGSKEEIRNVFFLTNAIKALNDELEAEGTTRERIAEIIKEIPPLQEELARLLGKETEATRKAREEAEKAAKAEKDRIDNARRMQEEYTAAFLETMNMRMDAINAFYDEQQISATREIADAQERAQVLEEIERNRLREQITLLQAFGQAATSERLKLAQSEAKILDDADALYRRFLEGQEADLAESLERRKKQEEDAQAKEIQAFIKYADAAAQTLNLISQAQAQATQYELDVLERALEQGAISRAQYDEERKKILRKQAQDAKNLAILQAVIGTAVGIANALPNIPLSIIAGVLGAVQIGIIAAEPLPQFATGVIGLQGAGTETSDSILARLSKGESVMTAAETKKYRPLLEGMRKGTLDEIIQKNYVRPAIDEALLSGFADMGKSAALQSAFNDMNLLRAIDRHRETEVSELRMMNALLSKYVRTPKRGYA